MNNHYKFLQVLVGICSLLVFSVSVSTSLVPIKEPYAAPDFDLPDMDGKRYRLRAYRGKIVIVNFWTSWCPPCVYEMPAMNRAWHKLKDKNVAVIAINVGEDEDAIFAFTGKYPVDFPLVMDKAGAIVQQWKVTALPTTLIINKEGVVVYQVIGGREWDQGKVFEALDAMR